jgi:nitroimidazol reductase NimA-like FMN-containing flavoprotein (pyridoxamine 5'-phosphate oxidase superfamily)
MVPDWPPGTVAILATIGEDGPHAIPVSTAMRAGPATVLLALGPSRGSLARLRAEPRCALAVIATGVVVTVRGRATIVGEAAGTVAVRIDVEAVDDHAQPTFAIDTGVAWRWTDPEAERRDAEVRAALRQLI